MDDSRVDYIEEKGIIYVRNKFLNDMNMVWNYTTRATSTKYFELEIESDSLDLIYKKEYVDSRRKIIESILKTIKADSIKFQGGHENRELNPDIGLFIKNLNKFKKKIQSVTISSWHGKNFHSSSCNNSKQLL